MEKATKAEKCGGEYARKTGQALTYAYEVIWAPSGRNISWIAKIRHGSELKGAMHGEVFGCSMDTAKFPVLCQLERNIEHLIDIAE